MANVTPEVAGSLTALSKSSSSQLLSSVSMAPFLILPLNLLEKALDSLILSE